MMDPRPRFQHRWARGKIVNLGCESDPHQFGLRGAVNVDIDRWDGRVVRNFVQADATHLPFADRSFDTAIIGDMLEHCDDQVAVLREACRIADRIVITVPTDATEEAPDRWEKHVEGLKRIGLVETAAGNLARRHGHRAGVFDEAGLRTLVAPVFAECGFRYFIEDTGARLPASPALGCVATREGK